MAQESPQRQELNVETRALDGAALIWVRFDTPVTREFVADFQAHLQAQNPDYRFIVTGPDVTLTMLTPQAGELRHDRLRDGGDSLREQLVEILAAHAGESGDNEGAVATLDRIIRERDALAATLTSQRTFPCIEAVSDEEFTTALREIMPRTANFADAAAALREQFVIGRKPT